jgi:hypothetical protein
MAGAFDRQRCDMRHARVWLDLPGALQLLRAKRPGQSIDIVTKDAAAKPSRHAERASTPALRSHLLALGPSPPNDRMRCSADETWPLRREMAFVRAEVHYGFGVMSSVLRISHRRT